MTSSPRTRQPPRTQQRLDPLGALAAWPLAPAVALIVVAYTAATTVLQTDQIQHPLLSVFAIVASVAAAGTLVAASRPDHAPFDRPLHLVMLGLAVSAHLLDQAARWGYNTLIQDDFGPLRIGLLLLALAPYRPWREIALSGVVAAVVVAAVTVPQAPFLSIAVPAVIYTIVTVSQVLAPAFAGAAYSRRIVRLLLAWQTDARRAIAARTEEGRGQVVRTVVEQLWAGLGAGVFPLLTGVLENGEVTRADIARAGELAGALRKELVRDIDKTWLDAVVDRDRAGLLERGATPLLIVADPEHRATAFSADQRGSAGGDRGARRGALLGPRVRPVQPGRSGRRRHGCPPPSPSRSASICRNARYAGCFAPISACSGWSSAGCASRRVGPCSCWNSTTSAAPRASAAAWGRPEASTLGEARRRTSV